MELIIKFHQLSKYHMNIEIKVFRYNYKKKEKKRFDSFDVPYTKGMTILDLLRYIQSTLDKSVSFRWECRSGICGTCGVVANGKPVLACSALVNPSIKKYTIEPLQNFTVEKDLIVDLEPVLSQLMKIKPYLDKSKNVKITKKIAQISKPFRKCIECGCCISESIVYKNNQLKILDPMALVKLARFVTDPRDGLDRKKIAKRLGIDSYTRNDGEKISSVCPRKISITQAINILKNEV